MDLVIRRATVEDVDNIVSNRMDFLYQVTGNQPKSDFQAATKKYLCDHMDDGSIICHIALNGKEIISIVIACIYNVIPKPSNIAGKIGYVFNVYTLNKYRGHGLATRLMKLVIDEARQLRVGELYLNATEDGKGLYDKLNFRHIENEMCLKLI